MEISQVATLANDVTKELLGDSAVVAEDLSNVVDIGKAIFDNVSYDKYVKTLVDHVGRMVFVDRKYTGGMASLYRDSWEYGAVMEKLTPNTLPDAVENDSWKLVNGTSYDPNVFTQPDVSAKFFNKRTTLEVDLSIADRQAKSAFSSAGQLNSFVSMLFNNIDTTLTVKQEALAQRTINNLIAQTVYNEFPAGTYTGSGVKAVNLLKLYNDAFSTTITADKCLYNPEFIRFASMIISRYIKRMKKVSQLFNTGELPRFTPDNKKHLILHSDFTTAADSYLQSDTFHNEYTKLPGSEDVAYWQGSGSAFGFADTSNIHVIGEDPADSSSTIEVNISGVIGVMFDHDAAGITNLDKRVTSNYNPKAEFTNYFYKVDCGYFNDLNENCVVFYVA